MIDYEKITEVARQYNPVNDMLGNAERAAFKRGIGWFKSALWHDISEEPKAGERIITEFQDMGLCYEIDVCNGNWADYCAYNCITRWCYLSNLLPKGGEK